MNVTAIIIFILCTLILMIFTWWISLRARRYHGIFRFFAFECILALMILNYPVWFRNPFSFHQIISWILLILCLIITVAGFYTFYSKGKPKDQLEDTSALITTGLFHYIRHPLYLSLILLGFGVMAKNAGSVQWILGLVNFVALILTARVEEKEMIMKFGNDYEKYMEKTKMFIPFIF